MSQLISLTARLATGKTTQGSGKVVANRGPNKSPYTDDAWQMLGSFVRKKLAPLPSSLVDLTTGEDVTGQEVTLLSELMSYAGPITAQEIYKAMKQEGVPKASALGIAQFFGVKLPLDQAPSQPMTQAEWREKYLK